MPRIVSRIAIAVVVATTASTASTPRPTPTGSVAVRPASIGQVQGTLFPTPPTWEFCRTELETVCYEPDQIARAYHLGALRRDGYTGAGRTIAVVVSYGSPTVKADLHTFDAQYGLPDTQVDVISPAGEPPAFDPSDPLMRAWAAETTIDVQWAHVIAPGARIVVVRTPVAETAGAAGLREIVAAENYAIDHDIGDVISQSFGTSEETFRDAAELRSYRSAFVNAVGRHVSVLAASGDFGSTNFGTDGLIIDRPNVTWPASDPLVTGVGGTQLSLSATGERLAPDVAWNDGNGASGGGRSAVFARPPYQDPVGRTVGASRGVPDISMSAAVVGAVPIYAGYDPQRTGWQLVGGTSLATPMFAGLVATADQIAGRRIGPVNPHLYALARSRGRQTGIVDVTKGDNTFDRQVPGYPAKRGYDLVTGWGTVNADRFCRALAASAR